MKGKLFDSVPLPSKLSAIIWRFRNFSFALKSATCFGSFFTTKESAGVLSSFLHPSEEVVGRSEGLRVRSKARSGTLLAFPHPQDSSLCCYNDSVTTQNGPQLTVFISLIIHTAVVVGLKEVRNDNLAV
jgi:hypothetical protein